MCAALGEGSERWEVVFAAADTEAAFLASALAARAASPFLDCLPLGGIVSGRREDVRLRD